MVRLAINNRMNHPMAITTAGKCIQLIVTLPWDPTAGPGLRTALAGVDSDLAAVGEADYYCKCDLLLL